MSTSSNQTRLSVSETPRPPDPEPPYGDSASKSMIPPTEQKGAPSYGVPGRSGRPGVKQKMDSSRFATPDYGNSASKSMREPRMIPGTGKGDGSPSRGGYGEA
jgi:hypothetical protein